MRILQILNDEEYIMIADLSRNFENVDNGIRFLQSDGSNLVFVELCHELDIFLNELVGGKENRAEYIPYNQLDDIHNAILVYDHNTPIGCAAFKKYNNECAEVKPRSDSEIWSATCGGYGIV